MAKVAAIQMNSGADVDQNLELTNELVAKAGAGGASLVVLPECFALMAKSDQQRLECGDLEKETGYIQNHLSKLASELKIWIMAAGVFVRHGQSQKVKNTTFLFNDEGQCVCQYDKIHLFNVSLPNGERYSESRYTEPGTELVIEDTPAGLCGITVCYDVRFPMLYRKLVERGAVWFAVPSAFAYTTGKDHWEILLRARAIENHAYVIAPAQWGLHPGERRTYGHSMIVDPWGEVIAQMVDGNGVIFADFDVDRVDLIRSRFQD